MSCSNNVFKTKIFDCDLFDKGLKGVGAAMPENAMILS